MDQLKAIFEAARALPVQDRPSYLNRVCADDLTLRAEVERLLEADAAAGSFLKTAETDPDATLVQSTPTDRNEQVGAQIGRYKLLEQIGEGGFGSVWAAEQKVPVKRRVALKIIKLGMDTKQVMARFDAERQALAMMDHPNIAKVLDAGATDNGRPYFVMELVKGVPILEYCDREKLNTKARLDLFMKVCHAIQHAHQKGIIHRDIKPGNVLVTLHDGTPVPKVIDFGIAKATTAELTQMTIYTQHHQMVGTPAYMSPEQAEMSGLDIDTRSDIYSLGVLLYELLTGTTPFAHQELMERGFAEMMRIIREETPHKPSTRLSTLGETGTRTAEQRHTDVKKLNLALKGDLDWIVMKCLEKDRTRRYDTANGLAADIVRHLSDEPVTASPPSASYKISKFVKRNRGQVIAGGIIAAMIFLGVIGTTTGMVRAMREKTRADKQAMLATEAEIAERQAKLAAVRNEERAIAETEKAERELARAREMKTLITGMLTSVSPEQALDQDTTLLMGILNNAARRLSEGEIRDEQVAAELHHIVGTVFLSLGRPGDAEPHIEKALEIRRRVLGDEHVETLRSLFYLAATSWSLNRFPQGEAIYREVFEASDRALGAEHQITMASLGNLALILTQQRRFREAEPLLIQAVQRQKTALGPEHRNTLVSIGNLAHLYQELHRYNEAEAMYLELIDTSTNVLGAMHPVTLDATRELGRLQIALGRYTDAEPLLTQTVDFQRQVLGNEHPDAQLAKATLARLYMETGRTEKAEQLFNEASRVLEQLLGIRHPYTLETRANLAQLYNVTSRPAEAIASIEPLMPTIREFLRLRNPITLIAMRELARGYLMTDRRREALLLQRELCDVLISMAQDPAAHPHTIDQAARALLDTNFEGVADPVRALQLAQLAWDRAAEDEPLWQYLDTLALAQHQTGDTTTAINTYRRAISLMPNDADPKLTDRLREYEEALDNKKTPSMEDDQ